MNQESGYKFDQEPEFRSSEGRDVPFSKKLETYIPQQHEQIKLEKSVEVDPDLQRVLDGIKTADSEQMMNAIIKNYNQQFEKNQNFNQASISRVVDKVNIGGKDYRILEHFGGTPGLEAQPVDSEPQVLTSWYKINKDEQLRGILADMVYGDYNRLNSIGIGDLEKFLQVYSKANEVQLDNNIQEFLVEIKQFNSAENSRV
jgi:hypothetical protein